MTGEGYGQYGPAPGQGAPHPGQAATSPGQGATHPGQGAADPGQGAAYPGYGRPYAQGASAPGPAQEGQSSAKGFVASLFDFGFSSFVTAKVVKVVYALIMIVLGLAVLGFAVFAFRINAGIGILALLILCPLYFFINLALWRITLELIMVIFRISEDLRSIRARGDLR